MGINLKILWDGDIPGMPEHKLSLGTFAKPLAQLVDALRRTASRIVADAHDDPDYGARGGKYRAEALRLDLVVSGLLRGSSGFDLDCLEDSDGSQVVMWQDLPRAATERLISDIADEARGIPRSAAARSFLASVPKSVTAHSYELFVDGQLTSRAAFGQPVIIDMAPAVGLPSLCHVEGDIVGVGFAPGDTRVDVLVGKKVYSCSATSAQIDLALSLRSARVHAMILDAPRPRLLWVRAQDDKVPARSDDERTALIVTNWNGALERLSR